MTIESKNKTLQIVHNMRGGEGSVRVETFTENLPPHCKFLVEMTLLPGCSVGPHTHHGECEIYYVVEGEAVLYDNGVERPFKVGDVCICYDGCSHGWRNETNEPVKVFAFVLSTD